MQSCFFLGDISLRITLGQVSRDDTISLLSRRQKSTDHFRTSVQGWYNPTATSLLPLSRKVFLNNTKLVTKVFELYPRQRLCQCITIFIYIFSMWILNYHHLYLSMWVLKASSGRHHLHLYLECRNTGFLCVMTEHEVLCYHNSRYHI